MGAGSQSIAQYYYEACFQDWAKIIFLRGKSMYLIRSSDQWCCGKFWSAGATPTKKAKNKKCRQLCWYIIFCSSAFLSDSWLLWQHTELLLDPSIPSILYCTSGSKIYYLDWMRWWDGMECVTGILSAQETNLLTSGRERTIVSLAGIKNPHTLRDRCNLGVILWTGKTPRKIKGKG